MRSHDEQRRAIPAGGAQILHFPRGGREGAAVGLVLPSLCLGAEDCADPFGGGSSPYQGEFGVMSTGDAIYLSGIAILGLFLAYVSLRFWWGE
jgi:hypothetical protein